MNALLKPIDDITVRDIPLDSYDKSFGLIPPDSFVVCRSRNGSAASFYGDIRWDRTPYDPNGRSSWLNFPFWRDSVLTPERDQLSREARHLMFILMWKRPGQILSYGSLKAYTALFASLANYAEEKGCSIKDILCSVSYAIDFTTAQCTNSTHMAIFSALMALLWQLGPKETGIDVPGSEITNHLLKLCKEYRKNEKQHAPLPTRIYSHIISSIKGEIDDFEAVSDSIFKLAKELADDPLAGRTRSAQRTIAKKKSVDAGDKRATFPELVQKYNLTEYFKSKNINLQVQGLSALFSRIQIACKLQVQIFTGMRDDEARTLPYHCIETTNTGGKEHCLVLGCTTKFNHGLAKRTKWVTNGDGHRAIRVAMSIANYIYQSNDIKPESTGSRVNATPLFVSVRYLPFSISKKIAKDGIYTPGVLELYLFDRLRECIIPLIEDGDVCELEQIDPHRAWRSEDDYQVGQRWMLKTHQFRRSLALYAQRSGLVTLPSLRRQLKHITDEMSRYYSKGSAFAINLIDGSREHFGKEWQETAPVSSALSYFANVLFTDDVLFGGHSAWINNRLQTQDSDVAFDREDTLRRFKRGELAYKETFLGGCTNTEECKQTPLRWLDVECLKSCTNLVGKLSKLEKVIAAQTHMVNSIEVNSVEYRVEKEDLDTLVATRNKILSDQKQHRQLEAV